jgi:predicted CoA-substrate-specific enzyme activase
LTVFIYKKYGISMVSLKTRSELDAGIDIGSVSINGVVLDSSSTIIWEAPYRRHFGRTVEACIELIEEIYCRFGEENIRSISFTGNHGQVISQVAGAPYEFETIAQILGVLKIVPDAATIISMGGQDTALLQIVHREGHWELEEFNMNGPCASGTGSFIDQQAERLSSSIYGEEIDRSQEHINNILEDFIALGLKADQPSKVACRCTVFTKSDMIHLQNKGERLENIIAGLHQGNAANYVSTIVFNRKIKEPVVFIGGMASNALQVQALQKYYRNLSVPPHHTSMGALGVVLQAQERGLRNQLDLSALRSLSTGEGTKFPTAPRLALELTNFPEDNSINPLLVSRDKIDVYLGIDIGSTTTKYAIINRSNQIIHKRYLQTRGKPIEVTQTLLRIIREEIGPYINILGVATTGSGRNVVGDFITADLILDEITAHARGGVEINPQVDTIFEIGGQDSKYICIENTHPLDFDMNKVCAAGTGSFLHELANKNSINIVGEFQELALSSELPLKLAERCTVFMESDLVSYAQKGAHKPDLIGGLCYAIAYNYLNRVVGKRKIGSRIMFLGGPSLNKAVVAAFEKVLSRPIEVPKHREVLGAFGAALSIREKMEATGAQTAFRGLDNLINDCMEFKETVCRADSNCYNLCKLKVYNFGGRKSVWGGECGRYDVARGGEDVKPNYFTMRQDIFERHLHKGIIPLEEWERFLHTKGESALTCDGRPTVGLQQTLYFNQQGVFWTHFFQNLGFQVVVSPITTPQIAMWGIETVTAETCFPIKVSHGHVKSLWPKTAYIFLPTMMTMRTPTEEEKGFFCPLMAGNQFMVKAALSINESRILNPTIFWKHEDQRIIRHLYRSIRGKTPVSRNMLKKAFYKAIEAQSGFEEEIRETGRRIFSSLDVDEYAVVVLGRPYNLYDERLNLRLGQNLAKIGIHAVPMDFLYTDDVDLTDFPDMYWGLGARILRTARKVSAENNLFGLYLTNFSCGPDSFLEHFYKFVMDYKPYLILELDEHTAVAGVMTRLEAYKNVIENYQRRLDAYILQASGVHGK